MTQKDILKKIVNIPGYGCCGEILDKLYNAATSSAAEKYYYTSSQFKNPLYVHLRQITHRPLINKFKEYDFRYETMAKEGEQGHL